MNTNLIPFGPLPDHHSYPVEYVNNREHWDNVLFNENEDSQCEILSLILSETNNSESTRDLRTGGVGLASDFGRDRGHFQTFSLPSSTEIVANNREVPTAENDQNDQNDQSDRNEKNDQNEKNDEADKDDENDNPDGYLPLRTEFRPRVKGLTRD